MATGGRGKNADLECLKSPEFKRSLECQYGLLDHLRYNCCLTEDDINDLNQRYNTERERNNDLIERINASNLKKFEQGLEETNQRHLANFIRRSGIRTSPDEEWPVSRLDVKPIDMCLLELLSDIHPTALAEKLYAQECISLEQKNSILSKNRYTERIQNRELLDIMKRRSIQQLEKFKLCLDPHLLEMLRKETEKLKISEGIDDASDFAVVHLRNSGANRRDDDERPTNNNNMAPRLNSHSTSAILQNNENDKSVHGVTVVGEEFFVVRYNQSQVNVYDSRSLGASRDINIPDMKSPKGLAGCAYNKALYISDWELRCIHRVDLTNNSVTRWKLRENHEPLGLSVTAEHTLLVTVGISGTGGESGVVEYTSEGQLVREIRFDRSIENACQTVQLSSDQFIVSHGQWWSSSLHRVCVINAEGQIIKSFGREKGRGEDQLSVPQSLAIDEKSKHVFVADTGNHRVLMLDSELMTGLGEVHVSRDLKFPTRLYFDSSTDRLFVGEHRYNRPRLFVVTRPLVKKLIKK